MSLWRRRLLELFPDSSQDWEEAENIYLAIFDFLPLVETLHTKQDLDGLNKAYSWAEWCMSEQSLWNAIGVSFYEHLYGHPDVRRDMHLWIRPIIYKDVRGLIELHSGPEAVADLDNRYSSDPDWSNRLLNPLYLPISWDGSET